MAETASKTAAEKKAASTDEFDVERGSQDASVNAGLELKEGDSIDGVANTVGEQTDGHVSGEQEISFHDAHGGDIDSHANVEVNPAEALTGVSAEQTEASLRDHHTADALAKGQSAELVPGLEARLVGHGPDAQHRFSGSHDDDVDSADHEWRTANVPLEACACGALRRAPL